MVKVFSQTTRETYVGNYKILVLNSLNLIDYERPNNTPFSSSHFLPGVGWAIFFENSLKSNGL